MPQLPHRIALNDEAKAMISVALCNGERMKSQIDAATRPKAKPDSPATTAPANVAIEEDWKFER